MGRGRDCRHLRPVSAAGLRAGVLERPRSDPEGAAVRPDLGEGNRGEDVKEYYFYLDNTPTHSYMRMLYKYPQAEYPYAPSRRGNSPPPAARARSSSSSTPASSTRTGTSTCSSSMRRPIQRTSASGSRPSIAGPTRATLHVHSPSLVSKHVGVGPARGREPMIKLESADVAINRSLPTMRRANPLQQPDVRVPARAGATCTARRRRAAVHGQRNQRPAVWGPGAQSASPFVKDAFHRCIVGRRGRGQPAQRRHEGVHGLSRGSCRRAGRSSGGSA